MFIQLVSVAMWLMSALRSLIRVSGLVCCYEYDAREHQKVPNSFDSHEIFIL